jgi:hypothetical protein
MALWHRVFPFPTFVRIGCLLGAAAALLLLGNPPAAHAESIVIISRNDCARLVQHHPAPDVAYQPGVDVRGRPVAPADLPGSNPSVAMPEEIAIDITVELQKRFGLPADSALYKPEARVGTVVVKPDGSATFDGQLLTSPEAGALAALCQGQIPR